MAIIAVNDNARPIPVWRSLLGFLVNYFHWPFIYLEELDEKETNWASLYGEDDIVPWHASEWAVWAASVAGAISIWMQLIAVGFMSGLADDLIAPSTVPMPVLIITLIAALLVDIVCYATAFVLNFFVTHAYAHETKESADIERQFFSHDLRPIEAGALATLGAAPCWLGVVYAHWVFLLPALACTILALTAFAIPLEDLFSDWAERRKCYVPHTREMHNPDD